ncbi:hypothetical protein TNCV_802471 [Trichonephila clavipes]|nr:hypothetical protein TNCV_802471 [Trichonephila clavipes]
MLAVMHLHEKNVGLLGRRECIQCEVTSRFIDTPYSLRVVTDFSPERTIVVGTMIDGTNHGSLESRSENDGDHQEIN